MAFKVNSTKRKEEKASYEIKNEAKEKKENERFSHSNSYFQELKKNDKSDAKGYYTVTYVGDYNSHEYTLKNPKNVDKLVKYIRKNQVHGERIHLRHPSGLASEIFGFDEEGEKVYWK